MGVLDQQGLLLAKSGLARRKQESEHDTMQETRHGSSNQ